MNCFYLSFKFVVFLPHHAESDNHYKIRVLHAKIVLEILGIVHTNKTLLGDVSVIRVYNMEDSDARSGSVSYDKSRLSKAVDKSIDIDSGRIYANNASKILLETITARTALLIIA